MIRLLHELVEEFESLGLAAVTYGPEFWLGVALAALGGAVWVLIRVVLLIGGRHGRR